MKLKIKPWVIRIPLPDEIKDILPRWVRRVFGIRDDIKITIPLDAAINEVTAMLSDDALWAKVKAFCNQMGADEELSEQYVAWIKMVVLTEIAQAEEG